MVKRVGLIGCGAIGTVLAEAIGRKIVVCDELVVFDVDAAKAGRLKDALKFPVKTVANVEELLAAEPTVVVEAAGQRAVCEYYPKLLGSGAELIIMSTGALLGLDIDNSKVHFPAGAIGGLDALAAAANAGISQVTLTTRKNPKALGKPTPKKWSFTRASRKKQLSSSPKK